MKRWLCLFFVCTLLLMMVGCTQEPPVPVDEATTTTRPSATEPTVVEDASLTAVKKDIQAADKLVGVAYLGGFEGTAEQAKGELLKQEYLKDLAFIKNVSAYTALDGWQMYCVVPADDSVTVTVYEYVFADEPYRGKELISSNGPILLRGNVSDIVPNLCIVATKGDIAVEYTPQQSGMDGKLVNDDGKVYDFTPYEYMPQFGGVDRVPDVVFCGDWWAEAKDGNGEERSLMLTLNGDGTAEYAYGIGNSEILEKFEGTWSLDKTDRLCLDMTGGPLNGVEDSTVDAPYGCHPVFEWEITADGLTLTHVDGDPILYGTENAAFEFASMVG